MTAKEIAAGFNSDGGLAGHSVYTVAIDRTQQKKAPNDLVGIDRIFQITVQQDGNLLLWEQHDIEKGKLVRHDDLHKKWPSGVPSSSNVTCEAAEDAGLSREALGQFASNAPTAPRAGKRAHDADAEKQAAKLAKQAEKQALQGQGEAGSRQSTSLQNAQPHLPPGEQARQ